MIVKLALYKAKGQIGNRFIRWWTGSQYSHCELVIGDFCYSSSVQDKGVRRKAVGNGANEISLSPDKWDVIDLPWVNADSVLKHFEATDGYTYGWPGLIMSQLFNRNLGGFNSVFCSEWCAKGIGLPVPTSLSPGTLSHWVDYIIESLHKVGK